VDDVSLAYPRARAAQDLLERELALLPSLPPALEQALSALSRFLSPGAPDGHHLAALDAAIKHLGEASGELSAGRAQEALLRAAELLKGSREEAIENTIRHQHRLLRAPPASVGSATTKLFRASVGVPSLHTLPRSPLALVVNAKPAEEAEDEGDADGEPNIREGEGEEEEAEEQVQDNARYEELLAWARDKKTLWGDQIADEKADIQRLTRDCMEDIAIFSSLRRVNDGEPWTSVESFEQRLLDNLDALIALSACGPGHDGAAGLLADLARYTAEVSQDQGRAFTLAFVLGCIDGPEAMQALALAVRRSTPHTRDALREALSRASHPAIADAMRRLLDEADPALVRLALGVLRFQRAPAFGFAVQLLHHPDPEVVKAAAQCLAVAPHRAPSIRALEQRLDTSAEDLVSLTIAESLLALGSMSGLTHARRCLTNALEAPDRTPADVVLEAARLVALAGDTRDVDILRAAARQHPRCTPWLGWFGHVGLVETLLETLESSQSASERPLARAAAEALTRILGVGVGASSFEDPAGFRAYWQRSRDRLPLGQKHRRGAPFTPLASLSELEAEATPEDVRGHAAFELSLALGAPHALEVTDWVARQRAELARIRARFEAGEVLFVAGQWPRQWLGARQQ
jgi:hypothetical protein